MDFKLPELGEGVYEAELVRWLVKPGDAVQRGQSLMEVLTDKATFEVPSNFIGQVGDLRATAGDTIKVGQVVLSYGDAASLKHEEPAPAASRGRQPSEERPVSQARVAPVAHAPGSPSSTAAIKAAPSVRLMARKLGIDLGRVRGSGPDGRILIDDLTAHLPARDGNGTAKPRRDEPQDFGRPGSRLKLAGIRKKIAEHLAASKRTIPHYSYIDECDVTDLVRLRDSLKEPLAAKGTRLTYLAFFVKAAVRALQAVPIVNAALDEQAGEIVLHDRYHIGIAVNTSAGLIVPVVRDADRKGLLEIAADIDRLSNDARTGKIKLEDLKDGVFTISSVGNIGGLISTPIINHPQVGILGIGKIVKRPVYDEQGRIRPADMLYLSFSFDHRVLDGAIGAAFGNAFIAQLRAPAALLL